MKSVKDSLIKREDDGCTSAMIGARFEVGIRCKVGVDSIAGQTRLAVREGNIVDLQFLTDEELLKQFIDGNDDAFVIIYERHKAKLSNLAKKSVVNENMVEDIVQEVFRAFLQNRNNLSVKNSLIGYLRQAVLNKIVDVVREKKRSIIIDQEIKSINLANDETPLDKLIFKELPPKFKRLLNNLTIPQREVIMLKYIDEQSLKEIAISMKSNIESVKALLKRGVHQIRRTYQLEEWERHVNE